MEKFQKINPFIFHVVQGVDEEIEKRSEGITFNIAGSNHLMPVARVTGKDFGILSIILEMNPYSNG